MWEYTEQQKNKLKSIGVKKELLERKFESLMERELTYSEILKNYSDQIKIKLNNKKFNSLRHVEDKIRKKLLELGFIEVITPTLLSRDSIIKMGISESDPIWDQIYWLENHSKCLRPMLAPNLYVLMNRLRKFISNVKIFEIGSCFRKERGRRHLTEFTMCNAVIFPPSKQPQDELNELIQELMKVLNINEYKIVDESSSIYGKTIDIVSEGIEIASCVIGPVDIDVNWKIDNHWVGIGLGLERLLMVINKSEKISEYSKSLDYLDGIYIGGV
ncbi:MAG: pyrrolysine--tRNA(Pyl) ligase large subunit [Candidatus Methanoglobus sp.]|jgi:phenylalanyl-tRNA synthetase alpha chain